MVFDPKIKTQSNQISFTHLSESELQVKHILEHF